MKNAAPAAPREYPELLPKHIRQVLDDPKKFGDMPELVKLGENLNEMAALVEEHKDVLWADETFKPRAIEQFENFDEFFKKVIEDGIFTNPTEMLNKLKAFAESTKRVVRAAGGIWDEPSFTQADTLEDRARILEGHMDPTRRWIGNRIRKLLNESGTTKPSSVAKAQEAKKPEKAQPEAQNAA